MKVINTNTLAGEVRYEGTVWEMAGAALGLKVGEDILDGWLMNGVADGDIEYGDLSDDPVDDYWTENENFKDLMRVFTACMARANKSGGLYCDGIVSE